MMEELGKYIHSSQKLTLCHILLMVEGLGKYILLSEIDLAPHTAHDGGVG